MIDIQLIEGISKALYDTFKVPVYVEEKENKTKFPCFLWRQQLLITICT